METSRALCMVYPYPHHMSPRIIYNKRGFRHRVQVPPMCMTSLTCFGRWQRNYGKNSLRSGQQVGSMYILHVHTEHNMWLRKSRDTYRNMAYNVDGRWMKYEFGALVEWCRWENHPAGSITCPITTNSIINSAWIGLRLNPGFYSQRPEANHLSYGAALYFLQFKCYQLPIFMFA